MKKLNLFTYGHAKLYSIISLPRWLLDNFTQVFRNLKYRYQRAVKGYCDPDLWNADVYLTYLISDMLTELADKAHGWPSGEKFPEYEDWSNYLRETANHFNNLKEEGQTDLEKKVDELYNQLTALRNKYKSDKEGLIGSIDFSKTPKGVEEEYKTLRSNWLKTEDDLAMFREKEKNIAFGMLKEVFFSLWD